MLVNGKRELCYVVKIDKINSIEGYDRVEHAQVGGWKVIVKKGEFKEGDLAVYFEVDSKLPQLPVFEFMSKRKYRVKTIKMCGVYSQGLLLSLSELNLSPKLIEGAPLTDKLKVTYYVKEDNERKSNTPSEAKKNKRYIPNEILAQPRVKKMMKHSFTRYLAYIIYGKKRSNKAFPTHFPYIHKTDEERCENMTWVLQDKEPWVRTVKLDGTSATYILERKGKNKYEFYVTSRNVRQLSEEQDCFHELNVYWEMANKYNIEEYLKSIMDKEDKYVCLQGEIVGPNVQKNPHGLPERDLYVFNLITSKKGRWDSLIGKKFLESTSEIKWVPIADEEYILPDDFDEFKLTADGPISEYISGAAGLKEGFVYRKRNNPDQSFKNVSIKYLMKNQE